MIRKPANADIKFKVIGIWFLINTVLASFIALMLSVGFVNVSLGHLFIFSQISMHITATIVSVTAYALGYINHYRPLWFILIVNSTGVSIASIAGIKLSSLTLLHIECMAQSALIISIIQKLYIPVLMLALLLNTAGVFFERFKQRQTVLMNDKKELLEKLSYAESLINEELDFPIYEKGAHYVLKFRDIIYMSSYGRKTVIHTEKKDFEVTQSFKTIGEKLPGEIFFRIHKQFIVNSTFIEKLKYHHGGRYILYLSDEDETSLPVGSIYTQRLKERLKIQNITS